MPREKVLTVCFNHETNTFSVSPTTMADFSFRGLLMGAEVEQKHAGSSTEHGGFIAAGERLGLELVHAVFARAQPAGRVADEDTEEVVVVAVVSAAAVRAAVVRVLGIDRLWEKEQAVAVRD